MSVCVYETHHAVDLQLAPLGQVDDVDAVVVQVLHAAVEVLPQEGSRFSRQRDASETQLGAVTDRRETAEQRKINLELGPSRIIGR